MCLAVGFLDGFESKARVVDFVFTAFVSNAVSVCACARACERIRVGTQVQSSSSVLILRVLTVSIESSWQLKEERKIGK